MTSSERDRRSTVEPQNEVAYEEYLEKGLEVFGPWASFDWRRNPRGFLFKLARYKFVAKMLSGSARVLEAGCGDCMGLPLLLTEVGSVHAVDYEPIVVNEAKERYARSPHLNCTFEVLDLTERSPVGTYDAAFSLDAIEHVSPEREPAFMDNICRTLVSRAVFIVGTPNIAADKYASALSKAGHVNLKSAESLRTTMSRHFHNVFCFSMNDEVVHTGYYPMAHYLFAMGVGRRDA